MTRSLGHYTPLQLAFEEGWWLSDTIWGPFGPTVTDYPQRGAEVVKKWYRSGEEVVKKWCRSSAVVVKKQCRRGAEDVQKRCRSHGKTKKKLFK